MVSTYPKSPSNQHCSTLQVYSPDPTQASRNHHQPHCNPLNSLSANNLPGSAYHLYLQRIACCYTLQLHSFRRRQSSTSACKCDSRARRTQQSQTCRPYHDSRASRSTLCPLVVVRTSSVFSPGCTAFRMPAPAAVFFKAVLCPPFAATASALALLSPRCKQHEHQYSFKMIVRR